MEKFYDIPVLGGFGANGFRRCSDRNGADIDKNTSSRYFLGFKANGVLKRHMIVPHTLKHNSYICISVYFLFLPIFDYNFIAVIYLGNLSMQIKQS